MGKKKWAEVTLKTEDLMALYGALKVLSGMGLPGMLSVSIGRLYAKIHAEVALYEKGRIDLIKALGYQPEKDEFLKDAVEREGKKLSDEEIEKELKGLGDAWKVSDENMDEYTDRHKEMLAEEHTFTRLINPDDFGRLPEKILIEPALIASIDKLLED